MWPPKQLDNWWIVVRLEEIHNTKLDDELKLRLSLELGDEYIKKVNLRLLKRFKILMANQFQNFDKDWKCLNFLPLEEKTDLFNQIKRFKCEPTKVA